MAKIQRKTRRNRTFGGLGGVSNAYEKLNMTHGHYLSMISEVFEGESKKRKNEPYIRIKHTILKIYDDMPELVVNGKVKSGLTVGQVPADIIMKLTQYDYHLRDWKNFLIAALGLAEDDAVEAANELYAAVETGDLPEDLSD